MAGLRLTARCIGKRDRGDGTFRLQLRPNVGSASAGLIDLPEVAGVWAAAFSVGAEYQIEIAPVVRGPVRRKKAGPDVSGTQEIRER